MCIHTIISKKSIAPSENTTPRYKQPRKQPIQKKKSFVLFTPSHLIFDKGDVNKKIVRINHHPFKNVMNKEMSFASCSNAVSAEQFSCQTEMV